MRVAHAALEAAAAPAIGGPTAVIAAQAIDGFNEIVAATTARARLPLAECAGELLDYAEKIRVAPSPLPGTAPLQSSAPIATVPSPTLPSPTPRPPERAESARAAKFSGDAPGSLTRALGLKIRRVVLDPGHRGQDEGTAGHNGLLEKDLVLDVALRLGKLIESRMGSEVIFTRSDETFICSNAAPPSPTRTRPTSSFPSMPIHRPIRASAEWKVIT